MKIVTGGVPRTIQERFGVSYGAHPKKGGLSSYREAIACSLVLHAEKSKEFSSYLRSALHDFFLSRGKPVHADALRAFPASEENGFELLLPKTDDVAVARITWFLNYTSVSSSNAFPVFEKSVLILAKWAAERETTEPSPAPKNVVLGIKIGVLPIGLMGRMKIEEKMPIIARSDFLSGTTSVVLAKEAVRTSAGVLEQVFRAAYGQTRLIEPEISEWFTGEREAIFYAADTENIRAFLAELRRLFVAHSFIEDENGVALLAVNPSINFSSLELQWDMKELE
jgi:hypothetical protein